MSPRSLLYFSVGEPNWTRRSLYERCFKEITNLVALYCFFSIYSITPFLCGDHTELYVGEFLSACLLCVDRQ